jgi:hypothetical protein
MKTKYIISYFTFSLQGCHVNFMLVLGVLGVFMVNGSAARMSYAATQTILQ